MKRIKRIIVAVVGGTVLALGIALIVLLTLLGLAAVAIPVALVILAMELARVARGLRHAPELLLRQNPTTKSQAI